MGINGLTASLRSQLYAPDARVPIGIYLEVNREDKPMRINRPYNFQLQGRAKEVFKMLEILAKTEPIETDPDWWEVRAYVIALDQDQIAGGLSMTARLVMRGN